MADPKPVAVVGDAPANHTGNAPQPLALVAPGFNPAETQTLKSVNGEVRWVTDTP
ncbi:hypothetical protein [Microbacterium sp.]|uniref:hypothetical protein n=1 Tax=Microbacterium sp. TaxID=51671 RepID=UPI0039E37E5A